MIKSMTGYASSSYATEAGALEIRIKSVNGRFCDVSMSANFELDSCELECVKLVKQVAKRGSITLSIKLVPDAQKTFSLNAKNVNDLLEVLAKLQEQVCTYPLAVNSKNGLFSASREIDLLSLANMPGVLSGASLDSHEGIEIPVEQRESFTENLMQALKQTLGAFEQHRIEEGARLRAVLLEKMDAISSLLDIIKNNLENLVSQERQRIIDKIAKLNVELEADRIEAEVAIQAQRADIAEEYDRLRSHIQSLNEILCADDKTYTPAGKRLDFMMQELVRESNTIASKASNLELTQTAVELKVLIEQMREQIQNIE